MKIVFATTQEVADRWAAQTQPEGRTSSNTRFRGNSLYSYGTEIARLVPTAKAGVLAALISSNSYSSGTSKVQGEAASAAAKLGLAVYRVPVMGCDRDATTFNLAHLESLIAESIAAIPKAVRWDTAANHRRRALELIGMTALFAADMAARWRWKGANPLTIRNAKETF